MSEDVNDVMRLDPLRRGIRPLYLSRMKSQKRREQLEDNEEEVKGEHIT